MGQPPLPVRTQPPGLAHPRLHGPSCPSAPPRAPIPQRQAQLSSSRGPPLVASHMLPVGSPQPHAQEEGDVGSRPRQAAAPTPPMGCPSPGEHPQAAQGLASPTCMTATATRDLFNSERAIVTYLVACLAPKAVSSQHIQVTHPYSARTPALILSLTVSSPSFSDGSSDTRCSRFRQLSINRCAERSGQ